MMAAARAALLGAVAALLLGSAAACELVTDSWHTWKTNERVFYDEGGFVVFGIDSIMFDSNGGFLRLVSVASDPWYCSNVLSIDGTYSVVNATTLQLDTWSCDNVPAPVTCVTCTAVDRPFAAYEFADDRCGSVLIGTGAGGAMVEYEYRLNAWGMTMSLIITGSLLLLILVVGLTLVFVYGCKGRCKCCNDCATCACCARRRDPYFDDALPSYTSLQ